MGIGFTIIIMLLALYQVFEGKHTTSSWIILLISAYHVISFDPSESHGKGKRRHEVIIKDSFNNTNKKEEEE